MYVLKAGFHQRRGRIRPGETQGRQLGLKRKSRDAGGGGMMMLPNFKKQLSAGGGGERPH